MIYPKPLRKQALLIQSSSRSNNWMLSGFITFKLSKQWLFTLMIIHATVRCLYKSLDPKMLPDCCCESTEQIGCSSCKEILNGLFAIFIFSESNHARMVHLFGWNDRPDIPVFFHLIGRGFHFFLHLNLHFYLPSNW